MLTPHPNLSESLCLLEFEQGWVFANTQPTLHQHPTQWVSVSAVASILACWSVSTCRWGVGGVLVGSLSNTPPTESPVYKGLPRVLGWVLGVLLQNFLFLHYLTPKSYYDILSERVVQTRKFSREFSTLPVIKSGFTPSKPPLYPS
jgi:hypothetical protein